MLLAAFAQYFFGIAIFLSSMFLILLVLVQRGRGGGLTGALGGPGGQSAFGTKAGDLFTKITIGVAVVWILLCATSVYFLRSRGLPTLGPGASNNTTASGSIGSTDDKTDIGTPDTGAVLGNISDEVTTPPVTESGPPAGSSETGTSTEDSPSADEPADDETDDEDASNTESDSDSED
ncbi:MAG: preprotein translocase subunit SecG [Pirellulaceae bacterium]